MNLFVSLDVVNCRKQVVNVVLRVHKADFLVRIKLERLRMAVEADCLGGDIHPYDSRRLGLYRREEILEESGTDLHGKNEIVQLVLAVDVGKG